MADLRRGVVRGTTVRGDRGEMWTAPLWLGDYSPVEADPVMVLVDGGSAVVLGPVALLNRPDTGTIAGTPANGRVGVTVGSVTYQARYIGTPPGNGVLAMLVWQGSIPWVMGQAASSSTSVLPTGTDPTPPPPTGVGTLLVSAVDTGSWRSNDGWGNSGSRPVPLAALMQGTYSGSNPYSGAAFYGSQMQQLAGATIDAIRLRVGDRLRLGAYSSALTLHVYVHDDQARPSGDVSRVLGPYDFTIAAGWTADWIGTLPSACYATLQAGGGISTYGSPYLGAVGIDSDPASWQLAADWHR